MSSFSNYRNKVKYNYILNATVHINKEFHDIKSIENLVDDEDFLQIYFKEPGLGRVYVDINLEKGFLFFRFGISDVDKKEDFTSKELKDDIIEMILSLNKNIDYFNDNNIERGDIKLHVIKDTESYDKKLVNEGKLTFVSDMTEVLKLTDEGKVEYYINNGLKESFDFSKQKVNTLCESLVQQGAWLEENDDLDSNLEQAEQNIKTGIEKVDELQNLKDELMNKVDTLVNESKTNEYDILDKELDELIKKDATDTELNDFLEKAANNDNITNQEYTKLQYKAQDTRRIDESKTETWVIKNTKTNRYLSEKSNNDYYWVKDIDKARKFSSYEDVFDFIERESKFGNNGADNWEEIQLNESKQFPSTENTKKRLCYNDIKGLNLVDNYLNEDQIKWIEENISNKYHFEDGFKNIYDLLELDDNDHFISIDEYIDNIQYMRKLDNEEGDNNNV